MGTILHPRVPPQCPGRLCPEPAWKTDPWSDHRPGADRTDTLLTQKKPQPQQKIPAEENIQKSQTKRKPRSLNRMSKYSFQGTSEFHSPVPSPTDQARSSVTHKKKKNTNSRSRRHTAAFPCHRALSDSSPDPTSRLSVVRESGDLQDDCDTDLSESERISELPCGGPPPQLKLRPEVITSEEPPPCSRHKTKSKFDFPDFLPPPFNSWSLNQLAYFYNMEGRAASRSRPTGPLERYLERLLQLEWYQIKTWEDNNGTTHAEPLATNHKGSQSTSARLSTPKCILQCQRAFPLTILSSVPSHCAYIVCTSRNLSCSCRSSGSQARSSRLSPTQEHGRPASLPKRSYSESRAPLSNKADKMSSPVRNQGHLKQMQAAGNLRNSGQVFNNKEPSTAKEQGPMWRDNFTNCRSVRSGSVNRKSNYERPHNSTEKRRGRSECRKGRSEKRAQQEIKPDAVKAILDNLAATKSCTRSSTTRQVEFVT